MAKEVPIQNSMGEIVLLAIYITKVKRVPIN